MKEDFILEPLSEASSTPPEIDEVFSNERISVLLQVERIGPIADLTTFATGVRAAVEIYKRDRDEPNQNYQFKEIENLYKKARRLHEVKVELEKQESYPSTRSTAEKIEHYRAKAEVEAIALSLALSRLSAVTIALLNDRGRHRPDGLQLPTPDEVKDPERYSDVCERIFSLCSIGRTRRLGRDRGIGKQSMTVEIEYYAPKRTPHPKKREAEMNFIMWVQVAWLEATGILPSLAASYENQGPFVRLIDALFHRMGVEGVSTVEIVNQLNSQRNKAISKRPTAQ